MQKRKIEKSNDVGMFLVETFGVILCASIILAIVESNEGELLSILVFIMLVYIMVYGRHIQEKDDKNKKQTRNSR